jgi:hypothetical protein
MSLQSIDRVHHDWTLPPIYLKWVVDDMVDA